MNPTPRNYTAQFERITNLCDDPENGLTDEVRHLAVKTLQFFNKLNILPSLINPIEDESLLFEFFSEEDYYLIEFYTDGAVIILTRHPNERPRIYETTAARYEDIFDRYFAI